MKIPIVLLWIISIVGLGVAVTSHLRIKNAFHHMQELRCGFQRNNCISICMEEFGRDTLQFAIQRSNERLLNAQNLRNCQVTYSTDVDARQQCIEDENSRFNQVMEEIDAQITAIRISYNPRIDECNEQYFDCLNGPYTPFALDTFSRN